MRDRILVVEDEPALVETLAYNLTRQGYRKMARLLLDLAQETAGGRVVTVLEGGYNLEVLEECIEDHLKMLLGIAEWE